jgi:hypothetical protein
MLANRWEDHMPTYSGDGPALRRRVVVAIPVMGLLGWLTVGAPPLSAAARPTAVVSPTSAGPGESVTLSGSGWPAGATVGTSIADATMPAIATASLGAAFAVAAGGNFSGRATIPLTLFGNGSRGNLNVVPGRYVITVGGGASPTVQIPFSVGAPANGTLLWGSVAFDANGNHVRDAADAAAAGVGVTLTPSAGGRTAEAITDALGRYAIVGLPAGRYALASRSDYQSMPFAGAADASAVVGQAVRADLLLTTTAAQQVPPATTPGNGSAPPSRVPAQLPATGGGGASAFPR